MNNPSEPQPLRREDLSPDRVTVLHKGRWANADLWLYRHGEDRWVIKDFSRRSFPIRNTWGAYVIRKEYEALERLQGIQGIPERPFCLDRFAVCYSYIPGLPIKTMEPAVATPEFFQALESLVKRVHERSIVHLDVRYRANVLVTDSGDPALIDFQTYLRLENVPRFLHQRLKEIDLSGVYKHWLKRHPPESLGPKRMGILSRVNRNRRVWWLRGYAGIKRLSRRGRDL